MRLRPTLMKQLQQPLTAQTTRPMATMATCRRLPIGERCGERPNENDLPSFGDDESVDRSVDENVKGASVGDPVTAVDDDVLHLHAQRRRQRRLQGGQLRADNHCQGRWTTRRSRATR